MGWAHAVLVVGHGWLFGWACPFYRERRPAVVFYKEAHLHLVLFLLSVKVSSSPALARRRVRVGGDARLEDHVVVRIDSRGDVH